MAEALGLASSIIAIINLSAKVVSRCSEYYAEVKDAKEDINRLQREAQRLKETLQRAQSLCDGPSSAGLQGSQAVRDGLKDCEDQLDQLEAKLEVGTKKKLMSQYGIRALRWPLKSKEVDHIIEKLGNCRDNLSFALQVGQTETIHSVHQRVVFDKLRFVEDAAFDSHAEEHNARCYQGTRVNILHQVDGWAANPDSESIFLLSGKAGTGKSTVARTAAQNFAHKGNLGASFFFKRGEGERGHAGLFITTITTQLAQNVPSLAPHVQNAIERDPSISGKNLKQQFETLVMQPLNKIHTNSQQSSVPVIVVDALDECDREEDIRIIIRLFSQVKRTTAAQIKFFLTSRPDLPIRLGFEDLNGRYEGLALHQIPKHIVKEDIRAFLEHDLAIIRDDFNKSVNSKGRQLPADWPSKADIQNLVQMASPLFLFAAIVCRFINDRRCGQPNEQLAKVLKYQTKSQASKLDATYLPILNQLLVGANDSERLDIIENFHKVVGSIIILASPLSAISLDRLLGVPKGTVESRTDLLHSVLDIPSSPDQPIRLFHLSFREFLVDLAKRGVSPFWMDERQAHQRIANHCIRIMSSSLEQDICGLKAPGVLASDVVSSRAAECILPEVRYACLYWIQHLQDSGTQLRDNDQVHTFLQKHLLHWLEAISWLGKTTEGIHAILSLKALVHATEDPNIYDFIHDIRRFVLYNRWVIEHAPLQLYSSALIFAPEASIVRKQFEKCIPSWIQTNLKAQANWNELIQTLEGHEDFVTSVAISSDGNLIVSGSEDGTARLWDAITGAALQTLEGHTLEVISVALSLDSKLVVSGSKDMTARIWDTSTGTALQTLKGHTQQVGSVAFSPDGKHIVSGSADTIAHIWDTATGAILKTLEGHTKEISYVAFLSDGKLIASGSYDRTLRIWDVANGVPLLTIKIQVDHCRSIQADHWRSMAFSPDGSQIVLNSNLSTLQSWDLNNGERLQTFRGHTRRVNSVAFSPDGRHIVSGSNDGTLRLWDADTGVMLHIFRGDLGHVTSVAFMPDGKQIVSGSTDSTLQLWDATTRMAQPPTKKKYPIQFLAFSRDRKLCLSLSSDNTARFWDTCKGALLQRLEGIPEIHDGVIENVAFTPDQKQVVAVGYGDPIVLWDVATGAALPYVGDGSDGDRAANFRPYCNTEHGEVDLEIGEDSQWIVERQDRVLYLPYGHRKCLTIQDRSVAIGLYSGEVYCLTFGRISPTP